METFYKSFKKIWIEATPDKCEILRGLFRVVVTGAIIPAEQSKRLLLAFAKMDQVFDSESDVASNHPDEDIRIEKEKKAEERDSGRSSSSLPRQGRGDEDGRKRSRSPSTTPSDPLKKKPAIFQVLRLNWNTFVIY